MPSSITTGALIFGITSPDALLATLGVTSDSFVFTFVLTTSSFFPSGFVPITGGGFTPGGTVIGGDLTEGSATLGTVF